MKQIRKRLTYANVMSSIAVFLVLGGGAAFAATQLPKNSVGATQIQANAVQTNKLARNAVRVGKIDLEAVKAGKIAKNAIATNRLRNQVVTTGKIGEEAVATGKIAPGAVDGSRIGDGAVKSEQLGPITTRTGAPSTPVKFDDTATATASCLPGETVIGGGVNTSSDKFVIADFRKSGNGWFVSGYNQDGTEALETLQAEVYCLAP